MGQVSGSLAKRAGIDGANHLTEDLRRLIVNCDFWMKAGWERRA